MCSRSRVNPSCPDDFTCVRFETTVVDSVIIVAKHLPQ